MYIYLKELIYSKWKELRFMYNYTKLSFLNLALERFVKKGVIQSSLYFYSLIKSKTLLECSNESSFPLFFHPVESKPLCESGRSRREETLQGHLGSPVRPWQWPIRPPLYPRHINCLFEARWPPWIRDRSSLFLSLSHRALSILTPFLYRVIGKGLIKGGWTGGGRTEVWNWRCGKKKVKG